MPRRLSLSPRACAAAQALDADAAAPLADLDRLRAALTAPRRLFAQVTAVTVATLRPARTWDPADGEAGLRECHLSLRQSTPPAVPEHAPRSA